MKHKRKSFLVMERQGLWWDSKDRKWVKESDNITSSCRRFKTLTALARAFVGCKGSCSMSVMYYKSCRRGKGWFVKWEGSK